jgi:hypothetical protein
MRPSRGSPAPRPDGGYLGGGEAGAWLARKHEERPPWDQTAPEVLAELGWGSHRRTRRGSVLTACQAPPRPSTRQGPQAGPERVGTRAILPDFHHPWVSDAGGPRRLDRQWGGVYFDAPVRTFSVAPSG